MNPSLRSFCFALASLLLSAAACVHITTRDFFFPRAYTLPAGFPGEDFQVPTTDGVKVGGRWFRVSGAARTLVCFEGNGAYLDRELGRVKKLMALGCNVAWVEYRGYGRSQGQPTVEALKADAEAAWKAVAGLPGVDPKTMVLHGYSMGCFFALDLAAKGLPALGVVLEAPVSNAPDFVRNGTPWYAKPFLWYRYDPPVLLEDNILRARLVHLPALVLVGDRDTTAPQDMAKRVFENLVSEKKRFLLLKGVGHGDFWNAEGYVEQQKGFLEGLGAGG